MATIGVVVSSIAGMTDPGPCLKSLEWADDVAVINLSGDTRRFHDLGASQQGQRTDWTLRLWAEERVDKPLTEQLSSLRRVPLDQAAPAYRIPIRSYLLGSWVDGSIWGPSPSLRLTREHSYGPPSCWSWDAWDHSGRAGFLSAAIKDYSVGKLSSGIDCMNILTSLWAQELTVHGQAPGLTKASLSSVVVLLRLLARRTMLQDGFAGVILSVLCAYATLLVGAKAWERRQSSADRSAIRSIGETRPSR